MSGLEYHLRCPVCGLTSPVYPAPRDLFDDTVVLPMADHERTKFDVARLVADVDDLAELAARHGDPLHVLAVPRLATGGYTLDPPLACPRCATIISEGTFGGPPPARATFGSLDEVVAATRALGSGRHRFVADDGALTIQCATDVDDEGARVVRWHIRNRGEVAIEAVVDGLTARLAAVGSRTTVERILPRQAYVTEHAPPTAPAS